MPNLVYSKSAQTSNLKAAPDPGYDVIPGNIGKLIFVMLAAPALTAVSIKKLVTWQGLLSKPDGDLSLAVITPFIDDFEIAGTTPIKEGGNDTTTWNGAPRQRGLSFAAGKGMIRGMSSAQAKVLDVLTALSGNYQHGTRIGAFFVHEGKGLGVNEEFKPVPIYNFTIGDPKKGGFGASDDYEITFDLLGGWSRNHSVVELEFEPAILVNTPPNP